MNHPSLLWSVSVSRAKAVGLDSESSQPLCAMSTLTNLTVRFIFESDKGPITSCLTGDTTVQWPSFVDSGSLQPALQKEREGGQL